MIGGLYLFGLFLQIHHLLPYCYLRIIYQDTSLFLHVLAHYRFCLAKHQTPCALGDHSVLGLFLVPLELNDAFLGLLIEHAVHLEGHMSRDDVPLLFFGDGLACMNEDRIIPEDI